MRVPSRLLSLLVLALAGCASAPKAAPRVAVRGCYELRLGPWSPPLPPAIDTVFIRPPSRIALDTTEGKLRGWPYGYALRPVPGTRPSVHHDSWWTFIDSRRLELVWTTGFSGVRMLLHAPGDTLRGTAERLLDLGWPKQTTSVIAMRIPCGTGRATAPSIRTDATVYRASVTFTAVELVVVATFTNPTRDTLFLHPCLQQPPFPPKVLLEKWVDGRWRSAWARVCTHVLMDPLRLAPGKMRTDTVRVWASLRPNEYPDFPPGPVAGSYRLVYDWVYASWDMNTRPELRELLSDSLRASNSFRIVE